MFYNSGLNKKIFAILAAVSLLFPFELSKTEAATSNTLSKTVEFLIGQDGTVRGSGSQFSFYFDNVVIPETPTVKSAIVEINGVFYNNSGTQTINVDLKQGITAAGVGTDYTLSGTTSPKPFTLKYDAWQDGVGPMSDIILANNVYDYTLYLKDTSSGGTASFSIASAKLVLTYNYPAAGAEFLKTTNFFIGQENGSVANGIAVSKDFTLSIPEQNPAIESIFIEASGIAKGSGTGTIGISLVDQGAPANFTYYNLDLGGASNITKFVVRHDALAYILPADFPGDKSYTLHLKGTGFSTNLWSAKIIVTYKYTEGAAGLPVSGYAISSTIDTGVAEGAAFNSLVWKGSLNSGKVRLQIATSNNSLGPWSDLDFKGPDCTSGTYYEPAPDTSVEVMCASNHNNKRYFRYKVILCSNDCVTAGTNNPEVTDVIVNWAP